MNEKLIRPFIGEEVTKALHQIHPIKAPGPDDILAVLFHKYWSIVGTNSTNMVLNVLNQNLHMTALNKNKHCSHPQNCTPLQYDRVPANQPL